ncbi:MAG: hypothetical protein ACXU86_15210 [Archangium sp.]
MSTKGGEMSKQTRFLLTVDSETGAAVKLERLGEAGDLTEVPLSTLAVAPLGVPGAPPAAGVAAPLAPQSLVINIYMGSPQQAAPLSISTHGLAGQVTPIAPGSAPIFVRPGEHGLAQSPGAPGVVSRGHHGGSGEPGGGGEGGP